MLNYSKKLDRKIFILGLVIFTVFLLATTTQTDFAATNPINNTTAGGISGAINSSSPGDIIELDEGTYSGNNNTNMTIAKNVTIQGKTKDKVILDAQGLSRIFVINNNLNVTFINITFTNAYTTSNGGGIYNNYVNTTMKFIDCIFKGNTALVAGGGIYSRGNITIIGSNFTDNTADSGGGLHIASVVSNNYPTLIVYGSHFNNNSASGSGGGISINACDYVVINNSNFVNNIANYGSGGGLSLMFGSFNFNGFLNIINSNFTNNTVIDYYGGGIYLRSGTDNSTLFANISGSTFEDNSAVIGGGLYVSPGGVLITCTDTHVNLNLENSIFRGNKATNGGALALSKGNESSTDATLVSNIIGTTFTDNEATNDDGGIFIEFGEANIEDSLIVNNYAGNDGGAIALKANDSDVTVHISDSEITDNTAGNNGGAISSITNENSTGNSTVLVTGSDLSGNSACNNGGALSSNTGENSSGNSIIVVIDSDIENNTAGNNGDTASATTGDGSSGDSEIDIIGDSTMINNNPDKDDDGIYTSTGENSTGNSEINIDDGVIKKLSSNSTIIVYNTVLGKTVVIRGVAIDENGNPLANIQLNINIDGVDYNVTTNALGEWSLNYTPSSPGTITVTVDLNENNKYYAFTNTTNFNVAKASTRSTIVISNATSGKSTIIRGVLVDENGNTIANAPINIVIGGKSNNLVTGADGSWSLSYTPLKAGNFIAKVYYNGNNNYIASTSSLNYTVAQGTSAPKKTDIRLLKKKSSKVFRHGKRVVMKWFTYKNYGAKGSKIITTKVIIKNLKYKLWKVYNKKLSYKFGNNKIKFKLNLKSGEKFKLKLKVYKPIKQK
ncbi:MAG: hypothetical protein VB038_01425 [Methanobrevibacter sp.]|uniref:beta strand repeat-containing protein n=1 Tax=Methanobrevibacter sp. TaxID=66852 RepID=UPI002B21B311|nr:hypothetical protein [Methanobrevibacter sp.]MEA4956373.1 hypothetical protein [Methanobrevibacter sp.]